MIMHARVGSAMFTKNVYISMKFVVLQKQCDMHLLFNRIVACVLHFGVGECRVFLLLWLLEAAKVLRCENVVLVQWASL